jgi:hypothetical protein
MKNSLLPLLLAFFANFFTPILLHAQKLIIEPYDTSTSRVGMKIAVGVKFSDIRRVPHGTQFNLKPLNLDTFETYNMQKVSEFINPIRFQGTPLEMITTAATGSQWWCWDMRDYLAENLKRQGKPVTHNLVGMFVDSNYNVLALKLPLEDTAAIGMKFFSIPRPGEVELQKLLQQITQASVEKVEEHNRTESTGEVIFQDNPYIIDDTLWVETETVGEFIFQRGGSFASGEKWNEHVEWHSIQSDSMRVRFGNFQLETSAIRMVTIFPDWPAQEDLGWVNPSEISWERFFREDGQKFLALKPRLETFLKKVKK